LIYTHITIITMPLTAISDFAKLGKTNEVFKELASICDKYKGLWNVEADAFLLENAIKMS